MPADQNGFWDFKSYTERTWFRDVIYIFSTITIAYLALHMFFAGGGSNFEYTKLNQEQMQFINRVYLVQPAQSGQQNPPAAPDAAIKAEEICLSNACRLSLVTGYLHNVFEGKLDTGQEKEIAGILKGLNGEQASSFLNNERFRIHSYFWLIGPTVYWEIVFWSLFGVLCNLLFMLGIVGGNSTTDLTNPKSQFDSSEILGQVAKILYAPLCVLVVILGYNYFQDQNVVDIQSSKGIIVFAFIGGFYSSRVIALMDRLKEILLPNSGAAGLPNANQANNQPVAALQAQLVLDSSVSKDVSDAAAGVGMNGATVQISGATLNTPMVAEVRSGDPPGLFTFQSLAPGNYTITVTLRITTNEGVQTVLAGSQTGPVISGAAPISITIK